MGISFGVEIVNRPEFLTTRGQWATLRKALLKNLTDREPDPPRVITPGTCKMRGFFVLDPHPQEGTRTMYYEKSVSWVEEIVSEQNAWRTHTINLIASENVLSRRARALMGSDFVHRYAEGHPGERYYQGTDKIDEIEIRVKKHLKTLFDCRQVDVRPISGTVVNDAVFSQYIHPGDIVLVNSTAGGGHISHHKVGSVGKYTRNIIDFPLTPDGYHVDVDKTVGLIRTVHPKVLILGKSLFLFPEPVAALAEVAKKLGRPDHLRCGARSGAHRGEAFSGPLGRWGRRDHRQHAQDLSRIPERDRHKQHEGPRMEDDRQGGVSGFLLQSPSGHTRAPGGDHL